MMIITTVIDTNDRNTNNRWIMHSAGAYNDPYPDLWPALLLGPIDGRVHASENSTGAANR